MAFWYVSGDEMHVYEHAQLSIYKAASQIDAGAKGRSTIWSNVSASWNKLLLSDGHARSISWFHGQTFMLFF